MGDHFAVHQAADGASGRFVGEITCGEIIALLRPRDIFWRNLPCIIVSPITHEMDIFANGVGAVGSADSALIGVTEWGAGNACRIDSLDGSVLSRAHGFRTGHESCIVIFSVLVEPLNNHEWNEHLCGQAGVVDHSAVTSRGGWGWSQHNRPPIGEDGRRGIEKRGRTSGRSS